MGDKLRPCPLCGSVLYLEVVGLEPTGNYMHPRRTKAETSCMFSWMVVRPPHREAWNTRAADAGLVEALRLYADPYNGIDAVPDFYDELSFGDKARAALVAYEAECG